MNVLVSLASAIYSLAGLLLIVFLIMLEFASVFMMLRLLVLLICNIKNKIKVKQYSVSLFVWVVIFFAARSLSSWLIPVKLQQ